MPTGSLLLVSVRTVATLCSNLKYTATFRVCCSLGQTFCTSVQKNIYTEVHDENENPPGSRGAPYPPKPTGEGMHTCSLKASQMGTATP